MPPEPTNTIRTIRKLLLLCLQYLENAPNVEITRENAIALIENLLKEVEK